MAAQKKPARLSPDTQIQIKIVAIRGYTTLRPLLLELAEKLGAVLDHRLRVNGKCDTADEWFSGEESPQYIGAADKNDENLPKIDDDSRSVADASDAVEEDDVGQAGWSVGDEAVAESEIRKMLRAIRDEVSENGTESDGDEADIPCDDINDQNESEALASYADPCYQMEQWTNCTITKIIRDANSFADELVPMNHHGCDVQGVNNRQILALAMWQSTGKVIRRWVRILHSGCIGVLIYNPLRTTLYELIVGWNIQNITPFQPNKGGDFVDAAFYLRCLQDEAAKTKVDVVSKEVATEESDSDNGKGGVSLNTNQ